MHNNLFGLLRDFIGFQITRYELYLTVDHLYLLFLYFLMALFKLYPLIRFQLPLLIFWWLLSLKSVTFILCPTTEGSLTFSSILDFHYKILFHNLSNFLSCYCYVSFSVCLQFSFFFFINSVFFLTLVLVILILCCTSTIFYI